VYLILLVTFCFGSELVQSQNVYPFLNDNGKWGYTDHNLKFVIQPIFDYVHPFVEGAAAVEIDGLWGFMIKVESE